MNHFDESGSFDDELRYDIDSTYQMQKSALKALQETSKAILTTKFENKFWSFVLLQKLTKQVFNLCAIHAKRVTLQIKNMQSIKTLREIMFEDLNFY